MGREFEVSFTSNGFPITMDIAVDGTASDAIIKEIVLQGCELENLTLDGLLNIKEKYLQ